MPGRADDLGLVALDRGDRAVHAERRRLDGIAGRKRTGQRQRLVDRADRPLGSRRALGRGAEAAVRSRAAGSRAGLAVAPRATRISSRSARSSSRAPARSRCASAAARSRSRRGRRPHGFDLRLERRSRARAALARSPAASARSACGRRALLDGRPLGRLRLGEQLLDPQPLGRDAPARVGDDARVEAEPLRDLERVRRARPAERDAVERRVRLRVEPRGRVGDAVGRARPLLQLRVVRRHDGQPRLLREPVEQRLRQRRALDRIGAGRELVDEDERALPRRAQDRDEVGDVAGEGREAHLDRLPVADVREHLVEDGQRRRRRPAGAAPTGAAAPPGRASSARPSCRPCSGR